MHNLFFFGTLVDRELLNIVLGNDGAHLEMQDAKLQGFRAERALDEDFPILIQDPDGFLPGLYCAGLTDGDLARIGYYEDVDYTLQPVQVRLVENDRMLVSQAYMAQSHMQSSGKPWHLSDWSEEERHRFRLLAAAHLANFGSLTYEEADRIWPDIVAEVDRQLGLQSAAE